VIAAGHKEEEFSMPADAVPFVTAIVIAFVVFSLVLAWMSVRAR
jgi:multisubunit Na+/H+ antiporter MnhC subunit